MRPKSLLGAQEVRAEWRTFFLTALRAGLREGELIALKWGDIQFGENVEDPNRYILVQRNYSHGRFTTPKSKKSRRVDLSRQLRASLMELRDQHLLTAIMAGKNGIADDLVFPSQVGTVIKPTTSYLATWSPHWRRLGVRVLILVVEQTFGGLLMYRKKKNQFRRGEQGPRPSAWSQPWPFHEYCVVRLSSAFPLTSGDITNKKKRHR